MTHATTCRGNRTGPGGVRSDVGQPLNDPLLAATPHDQAPIPLADGPAAGWFDDLYRSQRAAIVRLARLLTGSSEHAEDLAHDAFVRVYRRETPIDEPIPFLRTVTVNVCRNWHRGRQRELLRVVRHGPGEASTSPAARELDASLARLPYPERAVIVLRYWLGLSEAEIAEHLGCRPGTVKSRHARALRKLERELSP